MSDQGLPRWFNVTVFCKSETCIDIQTQAREKLGASAPIAKRGVGRFFCIEVGIQVGQGFSGGCLMHTEDFPIMQGVDAILVLDCTIEELNAPMLEQIAVLASGN